MPALRIRATAWAPAFAAGGVAGALIFHLVPSAVAAGPGSAVFAVVGLALWFVFERVFHHKTGAKATAKTYLVGDALHNFLDGGALAVAFGESPAHGAWLAAAVFAHELSQEWAEWGLLMHAGFRPGKILLWNAAASLTAFAGAGIVLYALPPENKLPEAAINGLLVANFLFVLFRLRKSIRPYGWLAAGLVAAAVPHLFFSHHG